MENPTDREDLEVLARVLDLSTGLLEKNLWQFKALAKRLSTPVVPKEPRYTVNATGPAAVGAVKRKMLYGSKADQKCTLPEPISFHGMNIDQVLVLDGDAKIYSSSEGVQKFRGTEKSEEFLDLDPFKEARCTPVSVNFGVLPHDLETQRKVPFSRIPIVDGEVCLWNPWYPNKQLTKMYIETKVWARRFKTLGVVRGGFKSAVVGDQLMLVGKGLVIITHVKN